MKKSIWIQALELRKMTNSQLAKYEINTRITNPDEPSDHELLLSLVKDVKQIKTDLSNFKKDITTRLETLENLVHNVIKLNNLKTE